MTTPTTSGPSSAADVASVPPRTAGETSDSPQRSGQPMHGDARAFDLLGELRALQAEPSWQQRDRNAKTLVHEPGFRVVLTAMKTGARLAEHASHGQFSVQTVTGLLRIHVSGRAIELPAGHLLAVEGGADHDVEALEESAFLLTIVGPR